MKKRNEGRSVTQRQSNGDVLRDIKREKAKVTSEKGKYRRSTEKGKEAVILQYYDLSHTIHMSWCAKYAIPRGFSCFARRRVPRRVAQEEEQQKQCIVAAASDVTCMETGMNKDRRRRRF